MDVRISVTGGGDAAAFSSLDDWLRHEPALRGAVKALPRATAPDELGTALDLLTVAVGAGGALSTLAASLRAWFAQPKRSDVSLRIERGDGSVIVLDAQRVADVEGLVRALGAGPAEAGE